MMFEMVSETDAGMKNSGVLLPVGEVFPEMLVGSLFAGFGFGRGVCLLVCAFFPGGCLFGGFLLRPACLLWLLRPFAGKVIGLRVGSGREFGDFQAVFSALMAADFGKGSIRAACRRFGCINAAAVAGCAVEYFGTCRFVCNTQHNGKQHGKKAVFDGWRHGFSVLCGRFRRPFYILIGCGSMAAILFGLEGGDVLMPKYPG